MNNDHALYRAADVRELDRRAVDVHGISAWTLMERAGSELFRALRSWFPSAGRVLVLCGSGNNGGDGYVLARLAQAAGLSVTLCAVGAPRVTSAAAEAAREWQQAGAAARQFLPELLDTADVVVDALLGTGLDRPVRDRHALIIDSVNAAGVPVLAADIPSGLNADTGGVMGCAIRARVTVSFIGLKAGLFTGQGLAHVGRVEFAPLDVPPAVYTDLPPLAERLHPGQLAAWLPPRVRTAHKGHFGHVLVLGGGAGMPGAVRLAAEAALRSGAGRVSAAVAAGNAAAIVSGRPEIMCHAVETGEQFGQLIEKADILVMGPGLGEDVWAHEMWQTLQRLNERRVPCVLDADGLNWLAREPAALNADDIMTPHPGEAARLLGCSVADVEADRFAAVRELARKYRCVAVLKGAGTLIADTNGRIAVCDRGNAGMASAGMGDVLTGVIAALRGQKLSAFDAACAGVFAHATAADRAARTGERGMIAGDLIRELRAVMNPGQRTG